MVWFSHSPSTGVSKDLYKYNYNYFIPNYTSNVEPEVVEETLEEQIIKHKIYEIIKYYNEQLGITKIPGLVDIELSEYDGKLVNLMLVKLFSEKVIIFDGKDNYKLGANKL